MESSHVMQQLLDIKHSLEKALDRDSLKDELEIVKDVLKRLREFEMTAELINKSGMGKIVATVRDKFKFDTETSKQALELLKSWREIMMSAKKPPQDHVVKHQGETLPTAKFNIVDNSKAAAVVSNGEVETRKAGLAAERKNTVKVLYGLLQATLPGLRGEKLALDIEEAIHGLNGDLRAYNSKARSLAFNMKKNAHLRELLEGGQLAPSRLVHLSAAELAGAEVKAQREKALQEVSESRRLDWLEVHRRDIQLDIGVDPENSWQFDEGEDGLSEPDADHPDA